MAIKQKEDLIKQMQKKDQVNAAKLKQKKEEEQANKRPNLNQYQNNIEDPSNLNYKRR